MENYSVKTDYEDIRPLNDDEVESAIQELLNSKGFLDAVKSFNPAMTKERLTQKMSPCKTKACFKETLSRDAVEAIANKTTFSLTLSGRSLIAKDLRPHTYISNHRDIVLDASFLNVLLYNAGIGMTQVAIGDNLFIQSWIETLVRLNNSFKVRRGVSMAERLDASNKLSSYIRHTINETKESVWIAQREGRAKDSNDLTQPGLLKMLAMSGSSKNMAENLKGMDLVPVSISYEIDPCDYLKAKEFQLKRDDPNYVKTAQDDLESMYAGVLGYKGRVHLSLAPPVNDALAEMAIGLKRRNDIFPLLASYIDCEIYKRYRLYPRNYVAYDMLTGINRYEERYGTKDKKEFEEYINGQIEKIDIPNKDVSFLRIKLLEMYTNPLINNLKSSL
ncbi:MAG: 1-acyl-sn-glycerol-3-phosphate acyltransferase [Massilibacteroides sp.]|nr:1-acyl-sn-glycerol-3-phosphate acyltransferase [Massilibacteroides sp.]